MAYKVAWQIEKQVILLSLSRESSVEDFRAFAREIASEYLDSANSPVHVFVDMTRLEKFPYQLAKLRAVTGSLFGHPALGKVVLVGRANPLAQCVIDTLARTFHAECIRSANQAEALAKVNGARYLH
jgi:hypothetical protein